jgi:hypothetical protein
MEMFKQNGFGYNFRIENKKLVASELNKKFDPAQIRIVNTYRFEGDTNPDDMSILYAIEAKSGERGLLVNAYGPAADLELNDFLTESSAVAANEKPTQ